MILNITSCSCGVLSLSGLSSIRFGGGYFIYRVSELLKDYSGSVKAYTIIFSDNKLYKNGERVAKLITEEKLGELTEQKDYVKNPSSGNMIKTWIWVVDPDAIEKYLEGKQYV